MYILLYGLLIQKHNIAFTEKRMARRITRTVIVHLILREI